MGVGSEWMFGDPGIFILVSSPGDSDPADSGESFRTQLQGLPGQLFCDTPLLSPLLRRGGATGSGPFSCCCSGRGVGTFAGSLAHVSVKSLHPLLGPDGAPRSQGPYAQGVGVGGEDLGAPGRDWRGSGFTARLCDPISYLVSLSLSFLVCNMG